MSPQTVYDVLSLYPAEYAPKSWRSLGDSAGFSGAIIGRVETALGPYCLRGWPVPSLPKDRILGLHRLLSHVFQSGLDIVPVPVAARTGETLVTWSNQFWQIEPWMPGQADYWTHPSPDRLMDVMSRLAQFHRLTREFVDPGPASEWFFHEGQAHSPAVQERLAYLNEWKQTRIHRLKAALTSDTPDWLREIAGDFLSRFDRMAAFIGIKLELLSQVRFRLQPCLRDVWHDHILLTGEKVTGVIDASACRSENVASDLARLLGSLVKDDRSAWALALEEYERHHPLDANEKALIEALDQSGVLLSGLGWMDRLLLKGERVSNLERVLERVRGIAERLKTLDESLSKSLFH